MNTIVELCTAVAAGLIAGLTAMLRHRKVARDVVPFLAPSTPWQRQLAAWNRADAETRKVRKAATAKRATRLRNIYLADLAAAAGEPVEVSAR